jgi:chromosome segregation ATPase
MIDKQFIESARNIRYEFLSLNKKLEVYKIDLENLSKYLQNTVKELESLTSIKITSKSDLTEMSQKLIKKLEEIDLEEKKISNLVKPINDKIDRLREEENILYKALKEKYPSKTDDQLKTELHSQL